jgi:hypothetical protein
MQMNMKGFILAILAAPILCAPAQALKKYNVLSGGYYDGPSVSGAVGLGDVFDKVPLGFEIELGYSWTRKGDATLACQVFINQAQNNNRQTISSGGVLDLGINATYPLNRAYGPVKFHILGGPRYVRWAVRHQYVNGNEDFDVVAHRWGLGGGVRGVMPLSTNFNALMQLEVNYYPRASIYGHDATYYPDNSNVNARDNDAGYTYTYDDALRATTVPHIRPRVMIGFQF